MLKKAVQFIGRTRLFETWTDTGELATSPVGALLYRLEKMPDNPRNEGLEAVLKDSFIAAGIPGQYKQLKIWVAQQGRGGEAPNPRIFGLNGQ